jgi:hypothetical protein
MIRGEIELKSVFAGVARTRNEERGSHAAKEHLAAAAGIVS